MFEDIENTSNTQRDGSGHLSQREQRNNYPNQKNCERNGKWLEDESSDDCRDRIDRRRPSHHSATSTRCGEESYETQRKGGRQMDKSPQGTSVREGDRFGEQPRSRDGGRDHSNNDDCENRERNSRDRSRFTDMDSKGVRNQEPEYRADRSGMQGASHNPRVHTGEFKNAVEKLT